MMRLIIIWKWWLFDPINWQGLDSMKTLDLETNEWRMQAKSLLNQHNIAIVAIVVFIYNNNNNKKQLSLVSIVQAQTLRVPRKDHACVSTR